LLASVVCSEATGALLDIDLVAAPALLAELEPSDGVPVRLTLAQARADSVIVQPGNLIRQVSAVVVLRVAACVVPVQREVRLLNYWNRICDEAGSRCVN
jgi:hypothetical protein